MVFAKLFDRFLDPGAAMATAGKLFRLRIDDFVNEEGAIDTSEAAEHCWRSHDDCLLLAGKVFGRNAAPKGIALFLSMPLEIQARLRDNEVIKRCQAMTIMGEAARERWRPGWSPTLASGFSHDGERLAPLYDLGLTESGLHLQWHRQEKGDALRCAAFLPNTLPASNRQLS